MTTKTDEQLRADFEAWHTEKYWTPLFDDELGRFIPTAAQNRWEAYRAGRSVLQSPEIQALRKDAEWVALRHMRHMESQPAASAEPVANRWPFRETPAEFEKRLLDAYVNKFNGSMISAVRHVLIENPPELAAPVAQEPVARANIYMHKGRRQFLLTELGTKAAADLGVGVHDLFAAPVAAQAQPEGVTLDGCLETLFVVGEYLGVDYAASRKAPGAPSGVYIKAIEDRVAAQPSAQDREDANEWLEEMDDLLLEHIGGYDERKLVMNHARRVIPILGTTGDLLKALIEAEEMLCKQEDALRSLGAHEPNSEPAILGARQAIDHARAAKGE